MAQVDGGDLRTYEARGLTDADALGSPPQYPVTGDHVKITGVTIFQYELTYRFGSYVMSHGRSQTQELSLVVRVDTDAGVVGWGETCPHGGTYLPAFFDGERAALAILGKAVLGSDPLELTLIHRVMAQTLIGGMAAKSAVDTACWDILGKTTGLSVSTLLGGRAQTRIRTFVPVPLGTPEGMAEFVKRSMADGILDFQLKVGNHPGEDADRVAAVMDTVDSDRLVIADANGGWNLQNALVASNAMSAHRIYLEQPCTSMSNCEQVRRHSNLPLILDECVATTEDLVAAKTRVHAGGVNIKPGRVGGLTPARQMRDTATELGMMVTMDDTWGGTLVTAALSHLAISTSPDALLTTSWISGLTRPAIAHGIGDAVRGFADAPATPGLGVEVDEPLLGEPVVRIQ